MLRRGLHLCVQHRKVLHHYGCAVFSSERVDMCIFFDGFRSKRSVLVILLLFSGSWSCVISLAVLLLFPGVKVLFRTALLVMRTVLGTPEKLAECPSFYETLEKLRLRQMPPELLDEEFITREVSHAAVIMTRDCAAVESSDRPPFY